MKNSLLVIAFLWGTLVFCQDNHKIDSLKSTLKQKSTNDEKRDVLLAIFDLYLFTDLDSAKTYKNKILDISKGSDSMMIDAYGLASKYHYYKYELDSALYFSKKALELALGIDDNRIKAENYRRLAILYSRKLDYKNAEKNGKLALENAHSTGDWSLIASAKTMLGNQFYKKNDYTIALKYYLSADSIYSKNDDDSRFAALVYDNIGSIYAELKDTRALLYIDKAVVLYSQLGDEEGVNYNYTLKAIYYQSIKEPEKAILNLEKALEFYENYGNTYRTNEIYSRLINNYSALGQYQKAEEFLKKAEVLTINSESSESLFELVLNAGQLYLDQKKYTKSIIYFNKANEITQKSSANFQLSYIREINKGLAAAYLGVGDYEKAYKYKQQQLITTDSINQKNNINLTKDLETKYQSEKKEQEIALLKSKNALTEQRQRSQRNFLLSGIGLTSLAGILLFVLYTNRQKTNKKLLEIDSLKSKFFTNISHEFRTPLALISAPIQTSLADHNISEEKRNHFEIAQKNTQRLSELIDQLLELSKIDSGNRQLTLEKITPTQLISAWAESFLYLGQQKNISFEIEIQDKEIEAWCDREALENITTNLLGNAVKYTPENGTIQLKAGMHDNQLKVEISNSGKGLTKTQLKTIFNRFYQTDDYSEGAGIGLSLVKELTGLHGGSVFASSEYNEMTTFTAILSVDRKKLKNVKLKDNKSSPSLNIADKSKLPTPEEPTHINEELPILLIVEDSMDMRTVLLDTFKSAFQVVLAENGETGITKAIENIPDLIISDLMMPIKDGIELTKTLKADERTSHIPIVLLTAKAGDENEVIGIEVGVDDYITKPFNQKILKSKVNSLIQLRQQLRSRYSQEVILKPKDIAVSSIDEQFLEKVQIVLDEHLIESSFTIEEFSKAVHMSRMQLHRKLKALTGLSASEFIRSQRLKLAAQLLKQSDSTVSEVGYSVGFNDHAYFSKCFKEVFKSTPSEFASRK